MNPSLNDIGRKTLENLAPLALLFLVLVSALAAATFIGVVNLPDTYDNQSDVNVSVTDTTCLDLNNQTVCYNQNNRSEVNLTQLQTGNTSTPS